MKEFYGYVSLAARVNFVVDEVKDAEEAKETVFNDIEGIELVLKDGTKLKIEEIDWDLIEEASRGNIQEPHISDFEIEEGN